MICNSLDLCQSVYLLGKYFSTNNFKKIGTSSCYYEVGYDILESLDNGISNSNTTFSGHFITPLNPRDNEVDLMTDFFEENKPDVIFGFHNGIYAKEHATYIKKNKINQSIPLYTTYFSTEDDIIQDNITDFDGIKSISTWFPELETEENKFFIANYTKEYNKKPSVFSLLGYENGLLINSFFKNQNLYELETKSPRGNMSIGKDTNRTNLIITFMK
ncbi:MAG: hypothetical protein HC850_18260 [Rhodomicrobium sp.]|nr:hypothetical protein [Rhodomicrobium sp.]